MGSGQICRELLHGFPDIKKVHSKRELDIAIGVEAFYKLISLIGKIGANAELLLKLRGKFAGLQPVRLKFFPHGFGGQVGDVAQHARQRQSCCRHGVLVDILAAFVIGVPSNGVAPDDIECQGLSRQAGGGGQRDRACEPLGVADCPRQHLVSAHRPANCGEKAGYAQVIDEPALCFHYIRRGNRRKVRSIALAGRRIPIVRTGSAATATQRVRANDKVTIRINCFAGANRDFPPARIIFRIMARYVRISAQSVTDQNRIVFRLIQSAINFVRDRNFRKLSAQFQFQRITEGTGQSVAQRPRGADAVAALIDIRCHFVLASSIPNAEMQSAPARNPLECPQDLRCPPKHGCIPG